MKLIVSALVLCILGLWSAEAAADDAVEGAFKKEGYFNQLFDVSQCGEIVKNRMTKRPAKDKFF